MTPQDVATVPPVCSGPQIQRAVRLLNQFRKQLESGDEKLPPDLMRWVAACLLAGCPKDEPEAKK